MPDNATIEIAGLNAGESKTLTEWRDKRNKATTKDKRLLAPMALDTSMSLFQLYLHGLTCEEILSQEANKGFTMGQLLEARVRDGWDTRRQAYLDRLFSTIFDRVKQTQMESVSFTTDLLAAAHKLYGDQLRKFLQTGDEKDLGKAADLIKSLDAYRKVADVLLKMTGQDKDKDRRPDMLPRSVYVPGGDTPGVPGTPAAPASTPPPAQKALPPGTTEVADAGLAARILDFFVEKERIKDDNGSTE